MAISRGLGRRIAAGAWLLCGVLFLPSDGAAKSPTKLSAVEQQLVGRALKQYNLVLEPEPAGRTIRSVYIFTGEVFDESDPVLSWLNIFHWTTREDIVRRELLFLPGEPYDQDKLFESELLLRDGTIRSVVAIVPVRPVGDDDATQVDLLVATRDIWSLRFNTDFQTTGSVINYLSTSLAENNIGGFAKLAALTFVLNQSTWDVGWRYRDPRVLGSRHTLSLSQGVVFDRDTGKQEGIRASLSFALPLYSRTRKWGYSLTGAYTQSVYRDFDDDALRYYDDPNTETVEDIPVAYKYRSGNALALGTRSFGYYYKQNLSAGYGFSKVEASEIDNADLTADEQDIFEAQILPRSETSGYLTTRYHFYTYDYYTIYNYNTFALSEFIRMGPSVSLRADWGAKAFGGDKDYTYLKLGTSWAGKWLGDGIVSLAASGASRFVGGDFVDRLFTGDCRVASPSWPGVGRAMVRGRVGLRYESTTNAYYAIGGNSGFRGLGTNALRGKNYFLVNNELRSASFPWWVLRVGGVLFYDIGDAYNEGDSPDPVQTVGLGLRVLIVSLNRSVLRIDYGVRVDRANPSFTLEGLTAGFQQAF